MKICLIPARKGSQRIKNKNIKIFNGKPLISYTIQIIKKTKIFDKIIVSTNCDKTARIARSYGAEVPFKRPTYLSNSKATDIDVLKHFISFANNNKMTLDYICYTYATNPLLKKSIIKKTLDILIKNDVQKVLTISKFEYPIQRALKKGNDGQISFREPEFKNATSQKLQTFYQDACQCYWYNLNKIKNFNKFEKFSTLGYELKNLEFVDLNDNEDLDKLNFLFKLNKNKIRN
tara:strand:+ start:13980 stop:14678 length:699 start_codon:yes stop_codon:yes gene_type:complete